MKHFALGMLLLLLPHVVNADGENPGVGAMRGLTGVYVMITINSESEPFKKAVIGDELRTGVELLLRQSGVKVVSKDELMQRPKSKHLKDHKLGILGVSIEAIALSDGLSFAICASAKLSQTLWLTDSKGEPVDAVGAMTWEEGSLLILGVQVILDGGVKRRVETMTKEFLNDWLTAHPK